MARIVGGRWGSRRLVTPRGSATRPTSERVREAVMNALASSGELDGASVLDLYAGSGALGLECASRGAARVVFVDHARSAQAAIAANIGQFTETRNPADSEPPSMTTIRGAALPYVSAPGESFDVVLADPPYAESDEAIGTLLAALVSAGRLRPDASIVLERPGRAAAAPWPNGVIPGRVRRYGDTAICYGRAS